ncbi:hypothetical protein HBI56_083950 [Parastagonospora nodorum]|nr:hypothetical protein HBI56_083950 [Parastagonospora nodorum]
MTGILTTARLVFKDTSAREKAIEAFRKIIAFTTSNEPEVLQYVCALPVEDKSGTDIYMIEENANQAASDAHLATKPVQDLIQLFTTGDVLAGPPEVHNCPVQHKKSLGQPLLVSSNPGIVLLHSTSTGADAWAKAVEDINELSFSAVVEDDETKGVRLELIFDSWSRYEAFEMSDAVKGAENATKIRPIAGFLGREDRSKL